MTPVSPSPRPASSLSVAHHFPVRGSIATRVMGLCVLCLLLACAFQGALSAGVAAAEVPKLVPNGYFSSAGAFGVAVDQPSGDVFVTGLATFTKQGAEAGLSQKFDGAGKVLSPPSPFAEGLHYGAAVNQTNGRLYAASPFGEIDIYDPSTGALLSSFTVPPFLTAFTYPELFGNEAQIATDSAGNVYVPNAPESKVFEYDPSTCPASPELCTPLKTFTGSGAHTLKRPTGVAVDSSGNVWVADTGDNRVEELSPTDAFLGEFASEGVRALALDGHGDVLAIVNNGADPCEPIESPCEHMVDYTSSGVQLADVGAGYFGARESMVAVDDASGRVYVTDGLKSRVWVFQPPLAPVLGQESAAEVGTSEAKLGALVSPDGALTTYRFEYDTREYKEGEGPHGVSVPFPEGNAGEGFSSRVVWAGTQGLVPGTTYHYRAVVTNGVGTVVGPDETFTTVTAAQASCPNEQTRGGFSAALPDCRAYELVTPVSKDTAEPDEEHFSPISGNFAASDGNRFSYESNEVVPGSLTAGKEFVAARDASGWSSEDALPLAPYTGDRCPWQQNFVMQYSADLSKSIIVVKPINAGFTEGCLGEVAEVVSGEPFGAPNLLLRNNSDGAYQLINVTPAGVTPTTPSLVAASADLSLVVFDERAKLTPDALNNSVNRYEWSGGVVRLLKFVLPSGVPVAGSLVNISRISSDGSDVFFTVGGKLYVRLNHGERTVQLDEARGGSGPGGGGTFAAVTADGSQVFFSDDGAASLTSDTVPGSGSNLYRYDVSTGQLSDLTPVSGAEAALTGISEDGSYVYFTSKGVLSGSQANQFGDTAESGQSNLYLDHGASITFLMHEREGTNSSNGTFLVSGGYLYSAASNRFVCASCSGVTFGPAPYFLSNSGQVFFQTGEALLPRDTNGTGDVYEFDYASGLHLISSGTGSGGAVLLGASPSGDDVFFLTRQNLVAKDSFQEANKIYDARVDGGFPEPALAPACTTADACRSASMPQPAIYGAPSSQTFVGAGNLASTSEAKPKAKPKSKSKSKSVKCKKGFVKRKGKCVGKSRMKAKKSAHTNRTGK
jgi:hypothetical protein